MAASGVMAAGRVVGRHRAARLGAALARRVPLAPRMNMAQLGRNLGLLFPGEDPARLEAVARGIRANAVRAKVFDKYFLPSLSTADFERTCRWVGDAALLAALGAGRGAVVTTLHYGRYWSVPIALSRRGTRVLAFQAAEGRLPDPERTLSGGTLSAADLGAPLRAVRALRAGAVVIVQLDAGRVPKPLVVDFLGQPTRVAATAVHLARAADALLVGLLAATPPGDSDAIRVTCHVTLDPRELPADEPPEATMRRVLAPLEAQVRADPSQWYGALNAHRRLAGADLAAEDAEDAD
jgi:lauroyl/myristoyl acyltransferase